MYHMKNVVVHDELIHLPKCMYYMKNPNDLKVEDDIDINISNQGTNKNMAELEIRQEQLLKKLDMLYSRIKTISLYCSADSVHDKGNYVQYDRSKGNYVQAKQYIDEIVLVFGPDNLPWYLRILLKHTSVPMNILWHIHSSVANEKVTKINSFVNDLKYTRNDAQANIRLIFKSVSVDSELKLSSLAVPIVGNVNILRYLSLIYEDVIKYDNTDYIMDSLLDLCHLLEKTPEKNKESIIKKIFCTYGEWIYGNKFSIVDLAAYHAIKQSKSGIKYVPKSWYDKCEKLCS